MTFASLAFSQTDYFCPLLGIRQNESALIKHFIFTTSGPMSH